MATYLDRILDRHRALAAEDTRPLDELISASTSVAPTRSFAAALRTPASRDELAVISEIKRRSPSKGALNADLDPGRLALAYAQGGASALSVLTDEEFFGGSATDLQSARAAVSLPVLRKDFTVSARDVCDARLMLADCVLLIAAALDRRQLIELHHLADEIGIEVLVEIHDEAELEAALAAGARIVGVNQRDLVTFEVDHERALRMAGVIPDDVVKVAESGVRGPDDAAALKAAGYHAVLVGETLVTATDPESAFAICGPLAHRNEAGPGPLRAVPCKSMFVKICGVTNEDDALFAVAMGADAIGFNFVSGSPRQIAPQQVYDITRRLPPEILTVGVFRDEHPQRVIDIVNRAGVKAAQLHGHETPADVGAVAAQVRWVIKAFAAGSAGARRADQFGTDLILVDAAAPGSGTVFDWSLVDEVPEGPRLILAGGLDPDNVATAVEKVRPWGVDVASGVERAPGRKDPLKVKAFIERARQAAPEQYVGPDDMPYDWADDE